MLLQAAHSYRKLHTLMGVVALQSCIARLGPVVVWGLWHVEESASPSQGRVTLQLSWLGVPSKAVGMWLG